MTPGRRFVLPCAAAYLLAGGSGALAQTLAFTAGEVADATVRGAPYTADSTTTVRHTLADGTRFDRTISARIYRDSEGRVRREQEILGLEEIDPGAVPTLLVTIVDPVQNVAWAVNPGARTVHRVPVARAGRRVPPPPPPPPPAPASAHTTSSSAPPPPATPPPPNRPMVESLGTRAIDGLTATGTRSTTTIPAGQIGNDRPITITDERWESTELKVLIASRHRDPRTGEIEYKLTNVHRGEPSPDLFVPPPDYAVLAPPPPPPPPPPARVR